MYPAKYYQELDGERLLEIIEKYPLATVICQSESQSHLCFIPIVYDEEQQVFLGHVMNSNPIAGELAQRDVPLELVFNGSDCYISPNFFPRQTVPTWHYAKVYVKGLACLVSDETEELSDMSRFIAFFERGFETPWTVNEMSEKNRKGLMKQISLFRLKKFEMVGYFKLNQHKSKSFKKELKEKFWEAHQFEDANLIEI